MEPFTILTSHYVVLPIDNIDTDQIIPAQFLKGTDKKGLGKYLFYHWRYDENGQIRPDFILNHPKSKGAQILVTGDNFGCGSSREHAPWALVDFGFRAVVSTRFADIFRNNALKNGLLPVQIEAAELKKLLTGSPVGTLTIDLYQQTIKLPDERLVPFPIEPFYKTCLLQGLDTLGYILKFSQEISEFERRNPPRMVTSVE